MKAYVSVLSLEVEQGKGRDKFQSTLIPIKNGYSVAIYNPGTAVDSCGNAYSKVTLDSEVVAPQYFIYCLGTGGIPASGFHPFSNRWQG